MSKPQYRQIGAYNDPAPVVCDRCGSMVMDTQIHDIFHRALGTTLVASEPFDEGCRYHYDCDGVHQGEYA